MPANRLRRYNGAALNGDSLRPRHRFTELGDHMKAHRIARAFELVGIVGFVVFALVGCDTAAPRASSSAGPPAESTPASATPVASDEPAADAPVLLQDGWLLGIAVPTDLASVISELGEPDSTELPEAGDPSPWGQSFRWALAEGAYTYRVTTDDYSSDQADLGATVVVSELNISPGAERVETLFGFELGYTTAEEVEAELGDGLEPSELATRAEFDPDDRYQSSLVYEEHGLYTFFMFDAQSTLTGIVQATFDTGNVD